MTTTRGSSRWTKRDRRGITLIELLVVVTVIGVLIALILPAVQFAREAARRTQCLSNLKQIALGVTQYQGVNNKLPMGEMPGDFGPHVAILAYVEQTAIYNSINFIILNRPGFGAGDKEPTFLDAISVTAGQARIGIYVCPSERFTDLAEPEWTHGQPSYWSTSYAWNSGTWWPRTQSWDGLFGRYFRIGKLSPVPPDPPLGAIDLSACTDGISQTLLMSEVANGPIALPAARTRVSECYQANIDYQGKVEQVLNACDAVDWRTGPLPWGIWRFKGYPWLNGSLWRNWFNTLRTPNQTCCVDGAFTAVNDQYWWFMIKPASSYHSQMVNGAMADGSVHAIKETIDRRIWMALSTRAGGELVSAESY